MALQDTKRHRKFKADKRNDMQRMQVGEHEIRPCIQLSRLLRLTRDGGVYQGQTCEPTSLPVEIVETNSCRSDCWSMLFSQSQLWTCQCCHMSSSRLVALQIQRSGSVGDLGACFNSSNRQSRCGLSTMRGSHESEEEGHKLREGRGVVEFDFRCLYLF